MAEFILMCISTTPAPSMEYSGPDLSFRVSDDTAAEIFDKHGGNGAKPNFQFYDIDIKDDKYSVCSYFSGPSGSYYTGLASKIFVLLLPEDIDPHEYISPFMTITAIMLQDKEKLAQRILIISKLMEKEGIDEPGELNKFLNLNVYDRLVLTYQEKLSAQGIQEEMECFVSKDWKEFVKESKSKLEQEIEKEEQVKLLSQLESKLLMIDQKAGLSRPGGPPRKKAETEEEKKKRREEEKRRMEEEKNNLKEEKDRIQEEFQEKLSELEEQKDTLEKQMSGIEESTREHVMDLTRSLGDKIRLIEQKDQEIAQLQAQNREIALSTRQYVEDLAASLKDKMAECEEKDKVIDGLKAQLSIAERSGGSAASPDPQLQARVQQLEQQNRELQNQLNAASGSSQQVQQLQSQIQELQTDLDQKKDKIIELEMEIEIVKNS